MSSSAERVVVFSPRGPLLLKKVVRDSCRAIRHGWVVNGAWTFEVKDGEHLAKDGDFIVNRWPAEPMREVVVPPEIDGDYNEIIEWAETGMNKKQMNFERVYLALVNDGELHRSASSSMFATKVFRAFDKARELEGIRSEDLPEKPKTRVLVALWGEWRNDLNNSTYLHYKKVVQQLDHTFQPQPQPQPEPLMNTVDKTIPIQTVTLVFGNDVKDMTEAELISAIKKIERERESLKAVKTPSKKVAAKIDECDKLLVQLAELLDTK